MLRKIKIIIMIMLLVLTPFVLEALSQEEIGSGASDQQMVDFSLAGYTQRGKKSWEIRGNSADIFSDMVKLTAVEADVYGEQEDINLVADKGEYDKSTGKMHLQENVVITTETGGRLSTDSLDWDRDSQKVSTQDIVKVQKENIQIDSKGLEGEPDLNKVYFKDEVQVQIKQKEDEDPEQVNKEPIIIICDGPMEIDYEKELAVFNNNVKVDQKNEMEMYADKMEVYFDFTNKKILRAKSMGNVKIVKGENISYSDEATYVASNKKMTLTGRPRLIIYSEENLIDAPLGN